MTWIRELIHIPERVHQGDFVLKLTEGVSHAEQTLQDYVVTPQLVQCFDDALGFIKQAVETRSSKAAYLHGSFGAGKSHFMAILNLLLSGNVRARSITELAVVVAKHNAWTQGKRFLLVPYHMIGNRDMESAILGQYADFVRENHPKAPVPGFYLADGLFQDAMRLRQQLGDPQFFNQLNADGTGGGDSGWGDFGGGWDATSFEAAMLEPPRGEERMRLVGDLIVRFFTAYAAMAESRGEAFVSLDDGLSIMSKHAKGLGYDAVILFLDELVLWLASRAADVAFVSSEGTKLVKLVEATHADRPTPLISFVARQRDLRELVGENLAGALQLQFADVLKHWEARFHVITLEDRNLPAIAEKRVLKPVSEAARQVLQNAFEEFLSVRREVLETLLTSTADRELFRQVYPFSPALVQALIAVSSVLQRERTALKLMLQLLVAATTWNWDRSS
ncbi:MAG: phage resistance protein, partial [bacterium]